jgi:hypothetical protein
MICAQQRRFVLIFNRKYIIEVYRVSRGRATQTVRHRYSSTPGQAVSAHACAAAHKHSQLTVITAHFVRSILNVKNHDEKKLSKLIYYLSNHGCIYYNDDSRLFFGIKTFNPVVSTYYGH